MQCAFVLHLKYQRNFYCRSIGDLWNYLKQFRRHKLPAEHLYPFIVQCHRDAG